MLARRSNRPLTEIGQVQVIAVAGNGTARRSGGAPGQPTATLRTGGPVVDGRRPDAADAAIRAVTVIAAGAGRRLGADLHAKVIPEQGAAPREVFPPGRRSSSPRSPA